MPEFNLDDLKDTWQKQTVAPKYKSTEIESMLNKSARNYVKYILWISLAEFFLFFAANFYYTFSGNDTEDLMNVLEKVGIVPSGQFEANVATFYLFLKMISLFLTGIFVILFYQNYRRIQIESNLKNLILQIINFKKTVQLFILANIVLVILFTLTLGIFTFSFISDQEVPLGNPTLIGFGLGMLLTMGLSVVIIWIYYRIVYGVILRRLGRNLHQLQNIEEGN